MGLVVSVNIAPLPRDPGQGLAQLLEDRDWPEAGRRMAPPFSEIVNTLSTVVGLLETELHVPVGDNPVFLWCPFKRIRTSATLNRKEPT